MYVVCISIEESWINRTDSFNVVTKKKKKKKKNYLLYNRIILYITTKTIILFIRSQEIGKHVERILNNLYKRSKTFIPSTK